MGRLNGEPLGIGGGRMGSVEEEKCGYGNAHGDTPDHRAPVVGMLDTRVTSGQAIFSGCLHTNPSLASHRMRLSLLGLLGTAGIQHHKHIHPTTTNARATLPVLISGVNLLATMGRVCAVGVVGIQCAVSE